MNSPEGPEVGGCHKIQYRSKKKAKKAANQYAMQFGSIDPVKGFIDEYQCAACNQWHIGHSGQISPEEVKQRLIQRAETQIYKWKRTSK